MDPEHWAEAIANSLFTGGPDLSYGRLFLAPAGQKQGPLLLGEADYDSVKSFKREHGAHELDDFWGFELRPKLKRCPGLVASAIWKTAVVWASQAYQAAGVFVLLPNFDPAAGSGVPWNAMAGCIADDIGCARSQVWFRTRATCELKVNSGHQGQAVPNKSHFKCWLMSALADFQATQRGANTYFVSGSLLRVT